MWSLSSSEMLQLKVLHVLGHSVVFCFLAISQKLIPDLFRVLWIFSDGLLFLYEFVTSEQIKSQIFHFLDSTENQALWDELASYKSLKVIKYLQ